MNNKSPFIIMEDGEEYFNQELALSILLEEEILFANSFPFSYKKDGKSEGETIVLFVNCNDIFAWACAEGETLSYNEVKDLYKMWEKDKKWGSSKWCCIKRNEKPQGPVANAMKKDGSWDETMEKLPDNYYDKKSREIYEQKLKENKI